MDWTLKPIKNTPDIKAPILLAGLPGIGNVSKIAVDFMIAELGAKKAMDISSYYLPHTAFVNEQNLIEIPAIALYHKNFKGQDFLFLAGDAQPIDEPSTYSLCDSLLDYLEKKKCKEIICFAGIGLQQEPGVPEIFCTANTRKIITDYKKQIKINDHIAGVVGPILGVAGLLPGLAGKRDIPAIILLAETYAHPLYVGIKGAMELVRQVNTKFKFGISVKKLEKDITDLEDSVKKRSDDITKVTKALKVMSTKEMNYIG